MDPNRTARDAAAALPLDELAGDIAGGVVAPSDDDYDDARRVWNGTVNEYPVAVAYCRDQSDAAAAVSFARENDVALTVRSGGHSVSGASVASGALVVDCSPLTWVGVDPDSQVARVGAGARWRHVDRATQSFGLAVPGGVVSNTGVAGLTLGGGTGYLTPKHGLTADNLRAVDVVTGRGDTVRATPDEHEDLFWAARGGGTVGVVTAFEFDLHPLDHDVTYHEAWLPADAAGGALREYRSFQRDAPRETCVSPYFAHVPATADFPADRHGELALVLAGVHTGDPADALGALTAFRDRSDAFAESTDAMAYTRLQSMMDPEFPAGRRYYWKSVPVTDLADDAIRGLRDAAEDAPSPLSTVVVWPMHGAVGDTSHDATPVVGRDAAYVVNVEAAWDRSTASTANVDWVEATCDRVRDDAALPGALPNFAGGTDPTADDVYADHADRLQRIRERYDPDGVFEYERD